MFWMQRGEAGRAKLASQHGSKRLPEQHFHQHVLEKQAQGCARQKEGGEVAGTLLLRQYQWSHLLFVPLERLLVGGHFVQSLGQQVGSGHGQ